MRLPWIIGGFCVVTAIASAFACSSSSSSSTPSLQPGDQCRASKDCAQPGSTCVGGFCTTSCNDLGNTASRDCTGPAAYGPACLDYYPDAGEGQHVCCPTSGCPWDCGYRNEVGERSCTGKVPGECCGYSSCLGSADAGSGHCYTVCDHDSDCVTGCCKSSEELKPPQYVVAAGPEFALAKTCRPKSDCGGSSSGGTSSGSSGSASCVAHTFYCDTANGAVGPYLCSGATPDSTCKTSGYTCQIATCSVGASKYCDPSCEVNIDPATCLTFNCSN